jgi:cell division control protein 7
MEGTFSTVYKAIDVNYDLYENNWDASWKDTRKWASPPIKKKKEGGEAKTSVKVVALKRIYVTSSPTRILNELELLHHLR